MRHIFLFFLLSLLLCGCEADQPQIPEETMTIPPVEATSSVLEETQPVDPMQMLLSSMTLEEKVGQLFLARCPSADAISDIDTYHLGGYILFGQDFVNQTPDSIRQILASYQESSPIPLLIAVDEEGGTVCRISKYPVFRSSRFPSPRESYANGGMEQVLAVETEKAKLLADLGINVNMGPVCDISTDFGSFMYARSLGEEPGETGRFVTSTVRIMKNFGIGSVLKHFPGYGNNDDTHTEIAVDNRSLAELESRDLIPFAEGIKAGCDAILVSHTIVTALDEDTPASLSPSVHAYLRNSMGFEGVIVTDDLVMQAITDSYGPEEAAVLAVLAGNDLLCSTEYAVQYAAVLKAVEENRISMEQLETSVLRVLNWKKDLGLIF